MNATWKAHRRFRVKGKKPNAGGIGASEFGQNFVRNFGNQHMSDTVIATQASSFRPSFYTWMTLLMASFVFGGFGMTYWVPLVAGSFPPAPLIVHLHGIVYFAWIILLVAQPLLVNFHNVTLHRSVGTFGIALATLVMVMGLLITLLGSTGGRENPSGNYFDGMYLGIMAVAGFGLLFTLAIRNVRRPEIHKRLILLAMLPILPPGIHRLYMVPFGIPYFPLLPMYLTLDALAIAILVHEWRSNARINTYTWFGVAWIGVQQILHYPVTHADWFAALVYDVSGMVHYR